MSRHHIEPRQLPGTGWTTWEGNTQTGEGGVYLEPNRDYSCFTIRETHDNGDDDDLIHFCDWRELVKAITDFMTERENIAREDGEL